MSADIHHSPDATEHGRVVILHGYGATPRDHWFPWTQLELSDDGIDVVTPRLPDAESPKVGKWIEAARTAIGHPDSRTVLIGHSLGTITALKALDGLSGGWNLAGLILVAGFDRPLPHYPELDDFTRSAIDYRSLVTKIPSRHVLVSSTDQDVPAFYGREVSGRLSATLHTIPNAGHFLASDGFTRLPLVAELARSALRSTGAIA